MTEILIRLTLLLLATAILIFALKRAEPTWRLLLTRSVFFAALLLMITTVMGPNLKLPVWKAAATTAIPTSQAAVPETFPMSVAAPQSPETTAIAAPAATAPSLSASTIFGLIWAVIAVGLLLRQVASQIRVASTERLMKPAPQKIQQLWSNVCHDFDQKPTAALIADDARSPHLTSRGDLILPSDVSNDTEVDLALVHVLRHEAAHLRANDHRWLPLMSALTKVLWFHPLAWWLNARHLQACEDARDAAAARHGGADAYRATIARFALLWIPVQGVTPSLFRKKSDLRRRLDGVQRTVKQSPASGFRLLASCGLVIALGIFSGSVVLVPQQTLAANPTTGTGMLGSWRALNPGSDYMKQIDLVADDDTVVMKLWPSTGQEISKSPTLIRIPVLVDQVRSATPNSPAVETTKTYSFKTVHYELRLTEKALVLKSSTRYTDDSGRGERQGEYYFVRGTYAETQPQENAPATTDNEGNEGWLGYWRNQDEGSRGTLQLRIHDVGDITLSVWGMQGGGISKSPISRAVLPIDRESALAGANAQPLKVTVDHGFCKTTYILEMKKTEQIHLTVLTDYTDPKRGDQEFLWIFERGKFGA
tara:strand:+ start:2551 stop:4332 length:1782 start_codon:yes stop_codon:yes gene_type:complete